MSHFAKLEKANVVDPKAFLAACAEMGMTETHENYLMRAWDKADEPVRVSYAALFPGLKYGIGLVKNPRGTYDMVSDWSLTAANLPGDWKSKIPPGAGGTDGPGNRGFAASEALRGLALRNVTRHTIVNKYRRQGFRATVTEDADQNLNIELVG